MSSGFVAPDLDRSWIIEADQLVLDRYPYPMASRQPGECVTAAEIRVMLSSSSPPRFVVDDEMFFAVESQKKALVEFAERNSIRNLRNMIDPWDLILEEFLDTEFDDKNKRRSIAILHQLGIEHAEVRALRERFEPAMIMYNFAIPRWDWVSLDQVDLLDATHPGWNYGSDPMAERIRQHYRIREPLTTLEEWREMYALSMDVTMRALERSPLREAAWREVDGEEKRDPSP